MASLYYFLKNCTAAKAQVPDKASAVGGSSINQILGIKGAKQETVGYYLISQLNGFILGIN